MTASLKLRVKFGLVVASAMLGSSLGTSPSSAGSTSWPASYSATRITWSAKYGEPKPLPFGTIYNPTTKDFGGIISKVYQGSTGWALGWNKTPGTEYALVSHNHGRTWATAGIYLAVSGAAGAAVNAVKAFTPNIVVAYDSGEGMNVLDITWNGGRTWNRAWVPGTLISVSNAVRQMDKSPAGIIQVVVASLSRPTSYRLYTSANSGRTWTESGRI